MTDNFPKNDLIFQPWLRFLVISLLLMGIFFRFVNLENKVYWHDEVYTSLRSAGHTGGEVISELFDGRILNRENLLNYQRISPKKDLAATLKSLSGNPEHSPLYYILTRFWMQIFGSSPGVTRSLAAIFSLMVFPCLYFLCLELFNSRLECWVAIAFFSISPWHIVLAQEAREYSLFTALIILSNATFLRAIRLNRVSNWVTYTVTICLGLYTSVLMGLIIIGQGIYLLINLKFRFTQTLKSYLIAVTCGTIAFTPWLSIMFEKASRFEENTNWLTTKISLVGILRRSVVNIYRLFADINNVDDQHDNSIIFSLFPVLVICILSVYSVYFLIKNTPQRIWLFLVTTGAVTAFFYLLPDLILGGRRFTIGQYIIPYFLAIQLSVSYLFARKISSPSVWQRKLWQGSMAFLITAGVVSSTLISFSPCPFKKNLSCENVPIAQIINQTPRPLVISNNTELNIAHILSLSYLLDPRTKFQLVKVPNIPTIPDGFSDVFLYNTPQKFREDLEKLQNKKIELVYPGIWLKMWRIVQNLTAK